MKRRVIKEPEIGQDVSAALAILQRLADGDADEIPEGWRTVHDWARAWSLSYSHTSKLLTRGVVAGKVRVASYRVRVNGGTRLIPVPHYLVVE